MHEGEDAPTRNDAAAAVLAELATELAIEKGRDGNDLVSAQQHWLHILSCVTMIFWAYLSDTQPVLPQNHGMKT